MSEMRGPLLCASILLRTWIAILNAANNVVLCMPTASIHYTTASTCLQSNNNNKRKLGGPWNSWPTCTLILGAAHSPSQSSSVLPSRCLVLPSLSLRLSLHLHPTLRLDWRKIPTILWYAAPVSSWFSVFLPEYILRERWVETRSSWRLLTGCYW